LRPFLAIHPKYPRVSVVKMNSAKCTRDSRNQGFRGGWGGGIKKTVLRVKL